MLLLNGTFVANISSNYELFKTCLIRLPEKEKILGNLACQYQSVNSTPRAEHQYLFIHFFLWMMKHIYIGLGK